MREVGRRVMSCPERTYEACRAEVYECRMQNFIAIAIFIADGLYNFLKIGILSLQVGSRLPSSLLLSVLLRMT